MSPELLARVAAEAMRQLPGWLDFCAIEAPEDNEAEQQKEAA